MNEANKKKEIAKISIFITSIFIIFMSVTYGFISMTIAGTKKQVITAGTLDLILEEDSNNISLTDALPMYDEVGMIQDPFTFRLVNRGTNDANYIVKLVEVGTGTKLTLSDVKYGLEKDGAKSINLLSTLTDGVIDSGVIKGNQTINYTLRLWIKDTVTDNSAISGKSLSYKINIETSQIIAELPPNEPILTSGMIPVVYDETDKTWEVADTTTGWYDYNTQKWANAVTVTEANRETYKNATPGTPISMDDINTMWVWIPRYSYTIKQSYGRETQKCSELGEITVNSPTSCKKVEYPVSLREEALNICKDWYDASTEETCLAEDGNYTKFEDFIDNLIEDGDITEDTRILAETYPNNIILSEPKFPGAIDIKFISTSEKETGTGKYKETVNNWVTPEGFTFGDEHIPGFWIGKFETTGSITTACTSEDCTTADLTIKPNLSSVREQRVSSMFYASRSMQNSNNANKYGFDAIGTGTMDTHMLKNTEWGIVAMLSQSKYGKYGNSNYTGTNKEVYQNKSSSYITGSSNGTPSQSTTNTQVAYDTPNTGYGASTTGTIYGVYDMSGGSEESVMGNYNNISGNPTSLNSGFCGTNGPTSGCVEWPDAKYYDKYTTTTAGTGYKPGDATYETSNWYNGGDTFFVNSFLPWFLRGGHRGHSKVAGVFLASNNHGDAVSYYSFRLALKP